MLLLYSPHIMINKVTESTKKEHIKNRIEMGKSSGVHISFRI